MRSSKAKLLAALLALVILDAAVIALLFLRKPSDAPGAGGEENTPARDAAPSVDTPGALHGKVLRQGTKDPVEGAIVTIERMDIPDGPRVSVITDAAGAFEATVEPDSAHEVSVTHPVFAPAQGALYVELRGGRTAPPLVLELMPGVEVRGQVVRSDTGAPLEDVEVTFRTSPEPGAPDVYPGGTRTCRTAMDGRFTLGGLVVGPHTVALAARGFLRKVAPQEVPGPPLAGSLEPGRSISGRVLDEDGAPVADARVRVDLRTLTEGVREEILEPGAATDEDGRYEVRGLPEWSTYRLLVSHEDYAVGWRDEVRLERDADVSSVDLRLARGRTVRGRVFDEAGGAVVGAVVEVGVDNCGIDISYPDFLVLSGVERNVTTTGAGGEYGVEHLAAGCYEISAAAEGLIPGTDHIAGWNAPFPRNVEVLATREVDLYLRTPRSVGGRVTDPDGLPLQGVKVQARDGGQDETDARGAFVLEGLAHPTVDLTASLEGYEGLTVRESAPGENVNLVLKPLASMGGQVLGPDGAKRPNRFVRLTDARGVGWHPPWGGHVDPDLDTGGFEVRVPEGVYTVDVRASGCAPGRFGPFDLAAGETRKNLSFRLGPPALLSGHVLLDNGAPLRGATVIYRHKGHLECEREAHTDDEGGFVIGDLPEGDCTLIVPQWIFRTSRIAAQRSYTLAPGETLDVQLEVPRTGPEEERREQSRIEEQFRGLTGRVEVRGKVVRQGNGLEGAVVFSIAFTHALQWALADGPEPNALARTAPKGLFEISLERRRPWLLLFGDGVGPGWAQVAVDPRDALETLEVSLPLSESQVRGVVMEAGTEIPAVHSLVELYDAGASRRSWEDLVRARRGCCLTDERGRFEIPGMLSGKASIHVVHLLADVWTPDVVLTEGGAGEVRIDIEPGSTLSANVMDAAVCPVNDAIALVRGLDGNLVCNPRFSEFGNKLRLPELPPGPYELTVVHPEHAPRRLPVELRAHEPLPMLTLSQGGSLRITVSDPARAPADRAEVLVLDADGRDILDDRTPWSDPFLGNPYVRPETLSDGTILFQHLRPGPHRVRATRGTAKSEEAPATIVEGEMASLSLVLAGP